MTYRKLSLAQVLAMYPCDRDNRHLLFTSKKTLTLRQAIKAGVTVSDLLWVAGKLKLGKECAEFAKRCAERAQGYAPSRRYASSARYAATAASSSARYAATAASSSARYAATAASYARAASYDASSYAELKAQYADIIELFSRKTKENTHV